MKVLLIDPPGFNGLAIGRILGSFGTNKADQVWPPYDLQVMAGICRKYGYEFRIFDANNLKLGYRDVYREIKRYNPDWVIYATCFQTVLLDAQVATEAKKVNPNIKTACISLSIFSVQEPQRVFALLPDLDFMPWGEPEYPLIRLMQGEDPEKIAGLYCRNGKREAVFTGESPRVKNLDELGIPVHKGLPHKIYKCPVAIRRPMTIVNCSRGCINSCIHCQAGNLHKPLRYRSVENVMEELREVKSAGFKEIKFYDCSLPSNTDFCAELCDRMVKKNFNFTWNCNTRAEFVTPKLLSKMKKAGCHTICIGCESAIPEILKNMKKNETVEQIRDAVRLAHKLNMRVLMYSTFGLPGETKETIEQTFLFIKSLKPEFATFGTITPVVGTPFYNYCKERGYLVTKELQWQDPNFLPSYSYPHLSSQELLASSKRAYQRYYFNPGYIVRRLFSCRTLTEFHGLMTNGCIVTKRYIFETVR